MRWIVRAAAVLVAVVSIYGIARSLAPTGSGSPERAAQDHAPASPPAPDTVAPAPALAVPNEAVSVVSPERRSGDRANGVEAAHSEDHGHARASTDPSALTVWLNEHPLSALPHRVARAYGGRPGTDAPVGLHVVVDPALPTPQLEALVRDFRERYEDAGVVSMHVYDLEEAAVYDRHLDGGALASRHLIARSVRDGALGVDSLEVRGQILAP